MKHSITSASHEPLLEFLNVMSFPLDGRCQLLGVATLNGRCHCLDCNQATLCPGGVVEGAPSVRASCHVVMGFGADARP